ncbi:hypothetical protein BDZ94DRAFT_1249521 [Collybia nuda]|uniref:Uncharacterized protein n=1 Tax=Collybia nuda TaxID=64659 RepID=A0A9P5YFT4_9AGAR|nr:hypothetical protein BDZ94DRAFT_1249521 [Collybia nuda]
MSTNPAPEINEAYFNACNFEQLMRGIHFTVLCTAISNIYTGPRRKSSSKHAMTALILALFVMSTMHSANYWAYVRRAFITHGQTSLSTADALGEYPNWYLAIASVSDANAILADCVIIWRCWVVWGRSLRIIVVPVICTLLTTAFSVIAIYSTFVSTTFGTLGVDYATALYSTSLVTTVFCTSAIVYRVIQIGTQARHRLAVLRSYHSIIEILVESSMLYCIATLFALVAYMHSGPASEFASAFWTSITGIAPTLIVSRVASGEARTDDDWNESGTSGGFSFPRFNKSETYQPSYQLWSSQSPAITDSTAYSDDRDISPIKTRTSENKFRTFGESLH